MGGLGQQAVLRQRQADVPRCLALTLHLQGRDDDGVEQPAASDHRDQRRVQRGQAVAQHRAHRPRVPSQILIVEDVQGDAGHRAGHGVAAVGGAVLSGPDRQHHVVVGQHAAHRVHAAGQGLAEDQHVRTHALVVHRQHVPGPGEARLDLVGHHQHVALGAERAARREVAVVGDEHPGLALDRLHQERAHRLVGERSRHGVDVVVRHRHEARRRRAEAGVAGRVRRERHDRDRAPVEVAGAHHDLRLIRGDALAVVAPPTCQLEGRLDALGPRVHQQRLVEAEALGQLLLDGPELVVVEGPRRQGQRARLVHDRLHQPGVAVPLVHGGVGRQEVVVLLALHVPHGAAGPPREHDREGVVVVGAVAILEGNERGGGCLLGGLLHGIS